MSGYCTHHRSAHFNPSLIIARTMEPNILIIVHWSCFIAHPDPKLIISCVLAKLAYCEAAQFSWMSLVKDVSRCIRNQCQKLGKPKDGVNDLLMLSQTNCGSPGHCYSTVSA